MSKSTLQTATQQQLPSGDGYFATFTRLLCFLVDKDDDRLPEAADEEGRDRDDNPISIALIGALFVTGLRKAFREQPLRFTVRLLLVLAWSAAICGIVYAGILTVLSWPYIVAIFWPHLEQVLDSAIGRVVVLAMLGGLAVGLDRVKRTWPIPYGIAGFSVGLSLCWVTLGNQDHSPMTAAVTLAAGVYLMVRSLAYFRHRRFPESQRSTT